MDASIQPIAVSEFRCMTRSQSGSHNLFFCPVRNGFLVIFVSTMELLLLL